MKRILIFSLTLITFFLVFFLISPALGLDFGSAGQFMKSQGGFWAAMTGVLLLMVDFFLPVPSSLVMIYHGMLFGPVWGSLLSVTGGLGAAFTGYYTGKSGRKYLLRFISPSDIAYSQRFFSRWGLPVIAMSRPVPLIAEATSVVAGMSGVSPRQMLMYSLIGLLPSSVIYAVTGALALDTDGGIISFLVVIGISAAGWLLGNLFRKNVMENTSQATQA